MDNDEKMYVKYIEYRNKGGVAGGRSMRFSQWKLTPIAQDYLAQLEASQQNESDDSGYTELLDELHGRIKALERDNETLRYRLGEAVEAFTELLGMVAISKDVSQYDFNMARKALQQMIKSTE